MLGTITAPSTGKVTITLNAAGIVLVQSWVDSPSTNNGIIIADSTVSDGLAFDAKEASTASNRPKLTVTYTAPSSNFDFSLSNGGNKSVTPGSSVTNSITATLSSGTSQSVSFPASGLPSGATASFSPTSCSPTCPSTLTIFTAATTPTGTYTITVKGTGSGGLTRTTTFTLKVNGLGSGISTDPDFKVAFIGDSAAGSNFQAVLNIIKAQGADMVLQQGDMSYSTSISTWVSKVNSTLGSTFPYFMSQGNHDASTGTWGDIHNPCSGSVDNYAEFIRCRMDALGIVPTLSNNQDRYSMDFKGLKVVFTSEAKEEANNSNFISSQLTGDPHIWKVCSWHKNQNAMQVGSKSDEVGWGPYETCLQLGAIVATAHEHSYARTQTLISTQFQIVDPAWSDPDILRVEPGSTFVFHSGLGGNSIRNQDRCLPTTFPYGCKGEWALIYTSDQGAEYGALFITFNVDGDPHKARGEFVNINGTVVDSFTVSAP